MDKLELSAYLCNLHTLLEAQSKGSHSIPSTVLSAEYEKHWGLLKEAIAKENEDEARTESNNRGAETGTDRSRDQSGGRSPDRRTGSQES